MHAVFKMFPSQSKGPGNSLLPDPLPSSQKCPPGQVGGGPPGNICELWGPVVATTSHTAWIGAVHATSNIGQLVLYMVP